MFKSTSADNKRKIAYGFTLIELLVVIGVIGLLSSIVLVSVSKAKERAELSKRKAFSQSIKNSLGSYIKGEWSFDDGTTTNTAVGSGSRIGSGSPHFLNLIYDDSSLEKKGIKPDGTGWYDFIVDGFDSARLSKTGFTVELWMYPTAITEPAQGIFVSYSMSYMLHYINGHLVFSVDNDGSGCYLLFDKSFKDLFKLNQWSHIAATYSNKGIAKVYVNGELLVPTVSSYCNPGDVYYYVAPSLVQMPGIEAFYGWTSFVNARFDQFRMYDEAF